MKNDKSLKNRTLKKKVKELILKSKSQGLIKPHTEAFKNNPVLEEEHKGKRTSFYK